MRWQYAARLITDAPITTMVTDVRSRAACVPIQKKTRPAMMVHGNSRAGRRHRDLKNAHECIFENNFVSGGSCLDGIVAIGESGFVLRVRIEMPAQEHGDGCRDAGDEFQFSGAAKSLAEIHGQIIEQLQFGKS